MIDKEQKELQNLLEEGIAALVAMRKSIEHSCADLRIFYSGVIFHERASCEIQAQKSYTRNTARN
jgi:hypothetical protein